MYSLAQVQPCENRFSRIVNHPSLVGVQTSSDLCVFAQFPGGFKSQHVRHSLPKLFLEQFAQTLLYLQQSVTAGLPENWVTFRIEPRYTNLSQTNILLREKLIFSPGAVTHCSQSSEATTCIQKSCPCTSQGIKPKQVLPT